MALKYNFFLILFLSVFLYPLCKNKKNKNFFLFLCFIPSFVVHAFVDVISVTDLRGYESAFNEITNTPLLDSFTWYTDGIIGIEAGYMFLFKLVSLIYPSFRFFLVLYSFVILSAYFYFIKKYSINYAISVLMLLMGPFNQSIFVIRQHLLVPLLFLFGYELIKNKKQIKFWVLVGICSLLHVSSLLFAFVYYLYHMKKNGVLVYSLIAVTFIVGGGAMMLPSFVEMMGYGAYLEGGDFNSKTAFLWGFYLIVSYFNLKTKMFNEGIMRYVFVLSFVAFLISMVGIGFTPSGRILLYFTPISILLIPIIYRSIKTIELRSVFIFLVMVINYYVTFMGSSWSFFENFRLIFF